jgi:hypothetical protein
MYDIPRDDDNWDNDDDDDNAVHKSLKYLDLKKIMANNMERIPKFWICQFSLEFFCLY